MQRFLASVRLVLIFVLTAFAQSGRFGRNGSTTTSTAIGGVFLSGTVVIDGGDFPTDAVEIQTICRGQRRTETRTDSHGFFTFQFGGRRDAASDVTFDADSPAPERRSGVLDLIPQDCELQAALPGFASDIMQLGGRISGDENADIGRIVLHRLANVEGFTISATTAQAPPAAKKAFEKSQEQLKKGKWDEAQKLLEKAVALDPKFAVAWNELGRVQLQKKDLTAARHAFQQSVAADPKYINPYRGLIQLAERERNWQELTDASEKLLALNPVSFPEVWLSNAISYYGEGNLAAAEKSARRGLQTDREHRVPKLEYLLGVILLEKPDYEAAVQHIQAFLNHATQAADVAEGHRKLDEIGRLSSASNVALAEKK